LFSIFVADQQCFDLAHQDIWILGFDQHAVSTGIDPLASGHWKGGQDGNGRISLRLPRGLDHLEA